MVWDNRGHDLDSHPDVDTSGGSEGQALLLQSGVWSPGDVSASGGGASELPAWAQDNVAASQTDVALTLLGNGRETVRVLADGDLTAVLLETTEARTAGTCTVTVQVNGSDTALTATLDGTNTEWHAGSGTVSVSQGDEVGVVVTTDGSWAPTTAEITVRVQVGTSGASSGGLTLLEEVTLASDGSISFSSIPSDHKDLLLVATLRTNDAANYGSANMRVGNGTVDTGANYDYEFSGSATGSSSGQTQWQIATVAGDNAAAGMAGMVILNLPDYTNTSWRRQFEAITRVSRNATNRTSFTGFWTNTADAIDIIELIDTYKAGSVARLYARG